MSGRHHTKLIVATAFGVFFLTIGLAAGAYLSTQNQDTRNQAWGGRRATVTGFPNPSQAQEMVGGSRRIRKIDGKDVNLMPTGMQRGGVTDYQKYLTDRNCEPQSYGQFCAGDILRSCSPQGKELQIRCADFQAGCGVIPVGQSAGKAACIPDSLGKTALPGDIAFTQIQQYVKGTCSDKGSSSCQNNVMTACTATGAKLVVPCADIDATCGVIPVGKYAGKSACIPNDLPELPKVSDPRTGDHTWPKVTNPTIGVPSISPLY